MTQKILLIVATIATISFAISTNAHHSSNPHFDKALNVNVSGVITELKLVNPHAYIYFDVEQDGEMVNWRCELSSGSQLKRKGWTTDLLAPGETITVAGNPARREDNVCFLNTLTLANGQEVGRGGSFVDLPTDGYQAAEKTSTEGRPAVLANGQPNIQGPWITLSFGRNAKEGIKPTYVSTAAGKEAMQGYDMAYDDPILQCHYLNLINGWIHDANVNDIIQTDDTVTLQYGFMDVVRTVHLNQDQHPENITPSSEGYSIGKWDGDTLVVHTKGFAEGVLNHFDGQKHSTQMEVIERFSVNPENTRLYRDYTVVDPLYLEGETKGQDVAALSEEPYSEFGCVELSGKNNVRPTDDRYNQIDASGVIATAEESVHAVNKDETEASDTEEESTQETE